ncbi:G-patch domain and KOW motifs-containing protein [Achroia grisella]|uniref:G-patch domain and KOW motifs-containing protein n=1 Tax=Achroia grisella TaxID=688607 RepID=UPI0027D295BB|nr:G-patch domain and KOW motifs-containing protein [Achroia grisella]
METKKISFGFMKTKKAEKVIVEEKKDFIECVEEKSIKVVGGEVIPENVQLVIPMKPNTLITAEKLKKIAEEVESALDEPVQEDEQKNPVNDKPENETLDQMAVRELLEDAKKETNVEGPTLTLPLPAKPVIDGEKESTLDDYESVPIEQFGMAMLRGMGWKPNKDQSKYKQPALRPKGLGLGADKVIADKQKKKSSKDKEEELSIVKNSYVKITTGKYSGYYGKVVSLDEDNGRVMVDIPIKKETINLSEFMLHPVNKSEFDKESKVINADSFEEYKKNEKVFDKSSKHDSSRVNEREASSSKKSNDLNKEYNKRESKNKDYKKYRDYEKSSNVQSRDRYRRDSSASEDKYKHRKKKDKKYSSTDTDSLSSLSDTDMRRKDKNNRRRCSSDSDSSHKKDKRKKKHEGKRDIDKKRKGKKKKRDRDRSPNYKKYRK